MSAKHQEHTAKRQNTSRFMLSDVAKSCSFQVKRCFSKDLVEMQSVAPLTFLYVSLRRQENHSQTIGKQQKLARVTNELSFPLATA